MRKKKQYPLQAVQLMNAEFNDTFKSHPSATSQSG